MLLSYNRLTGLVEAEILEGVDFGNINGASIDITLGQDIMVEIPMRQRIDLKSKQFPKMERVVLPEQGFELQPGRFILASSHEVFNLPNNIAAEYKLKSSLARSGLQHLLAGWCDPGWNGSCLTLELHNITKGCVLVLKPGMKIGQMVFWECEPVPTGKDYGARGQYNNDKTVTSNKGLR